MSDLPIANYENKIISLIKSNPSIIIVGETGSGKTTQIPQFIHSHFKNSNICITQPRRVAAISIAKRVAQEMNVVLGKQVGYSVRFDDKSSPETTIKYMTDGMLLRELLSDVLLSKYNFIILDEAHERTLRTDILFGMLKRIQKKRKNLKIIIMSATLNAQKFSTFFNSAKIIEVSGRQHPVQLSYAPEPLEDHVDAALVTIFQIHTDYTPGDILVFLTGQEEIENLEKLLKDYESDLPPESEKLLVCPLFASLPTAAQILAFDPAPEGTRKVILSTNIAETSITLPGIKYVIDTGLVKVRAYNPKIGIESLTVQPISQANANQRMGRAGRDSPGQCFRLYTETSFKQLNSDMEPEIKRCNLSSVLLLLKASGVEDVVGFDYMDAPPRDSIVSALENLYALGALTDKGELSALGKKMAGFPIDPVFSKILIESEEHECTLDIISIISMLSIEPVFYSPRDKREEANESKKVFANYNGDHLTLLNVLKEYQSQKSESSQWCIDNYISNRSMKQIMDIRKQLIEFCQSYKIKTQANEVEPEVLLKCLLAGSFRNTAVLQHDGSYKTLVGRQVVYMHPSSVLFGKKVEAVVYSELRIDRILNLFIKRMFLYHLTLSPQQSISSAIVGNFTGEKQQEIVFNKNSILQLLRPDPTTGKIHSLCQHQVFGIIRSISTFRLTGFTKDFVVVLSDSGRITILEFNTIKHVFERVHMETYGKTGCRRLVPGQYVATDPKGRAIMIGAVEKSKFVYVLNRDAKAKLTISSPLEAHKTNTICFHMTSVDVGFENPCFACIELDYTDADQDHTGEAAKNATKFLTFYELDLGLNHVVRKWNEPIEPSSNYLISVPGGSDGPSGVLVCSENFITWRHPDYPSARIPIPRRPNLLLVPEDPVIIISSVVHRLKNGFFILCQTELGDLFKITMDFMAGNDGIMGGVDNLKIKYFDTVPVANSLLLLKTGFLFVASEFGNHFLYQIENLGDDDEQQIEFSSLDTPQEGDKYSVVFSPRELRNIVAVDEIESLSPIIDATVANLTNEESPQIYMLCGKGAQSCFKVLRHGLQVSEMAVSELPGNPNAVWTVKATSHDEFDSFIIVSFVNATLVLSIGETVEEVTDTGFLSSTPTITVGQLGEDSLVQIYPSGIRHIRVDRRVSEWKAPGNRVIEKATCNRRQVVIALSGGEIVYFELDTLGQLNEYQERKEMTSNVQTMCIGPIPEGRQRSRFLAIGCADNTVRILSLDPDSCMQSLSMQAITATPESLAITNTLDPATGVSTFYLNIGLQNGIFLKTVLDSVTGVLSDSRLRFLGTRPVKLFKIKVDNGDAILALSSRPWLSFNYSGRYKIMPLSYELLEHGASFCTEHCAEGFVAINGNTLRILAVDKLDSVFNQTVVSLKYTPRRFAIEPIQKNFIIIESENNTFSSSEISKRLKVKSSASEMNTSDGEVSQLPVEQFGHLIAGHGNWASCIRIVNSIEGRTVSMEELEGNEAALSLALCTFNQRPGENFIVIGTAVDYDISSGKCTFGFLRTYLITSEGTLTLIHKTATEEAPLAVCSYKGRLLVGVGKYLRMYEMGKKKMLRKCESMPFPTRIIKLECMSYRIIVSDIQESIHYATYRSVENKFVVFADDSTARWMSCSTILDFNTVAGGDKFGNFFVSRIPSDTLEVIEEDPSGTRMVYQRGYLQGALFKLDHIADFFVGDILTSLTKTAMLPGGREVIVYTTLHGNIGMFVPFVSKDDVDMFKTLEMQLRSELPPICGRDHLMYRSYYFPVKGVIDGDLCELFNTLANEKKREIGESVDRTVTELSKKLEDVRNRVAF